MFAETSSYSEGLEKSYFLDEIQKTEKFIELNRDFLESKVNFTHKNVSSRQGQVLILHIMHLTVLLNVLTISLLLLFRNKIS